MFPTTQSFEVLMLPEDEDGLRHTASSTANEGPGNQGLYVKRKPKICEAWCSQLLQWPTRPSF